MLHKLLVFTAFSIVGSAVVNAQDSPAVPKGKVEKRIERFVFSAPFERSYLGVQTVEISKENYAKFGLAQARGVGVEKVLENSPAANAGVQVGDVIIGFEGEEIKGTAKLTRLIAEVAPDQTAKITVLRGGTEREFSVVIGKRETPPMPNGALSGFYGLPSVPELAAPGKSPTARSFPLLTDENNVFIQRATANRQIGIGVTVLTEQLGDYFGVPEGRGLLINNIRENSPAANAGLKAGDVIVEAEGREVLKQTDLTRAVNLKKEGDISLTIVRNRNPQTLRVTPENSKTGAIRFEEFENLFEGSPNQNDFRLLTPPIMPPSPPAPMPLKPAPRIL